MLMQEYKRLMKLASDFYYQNFLNPNSALDEINTIQNKVWRTLKVRQTSIAESGLKIIKQQWFEQK